MRNMQQLTQILEDIGKPAETLRAADGAAVIVLPYGGRVLGLFAPDGDNFFWTHPALASASSARAFFESDQWHNSGGDRTWLAPEIDFFFPKFPDLAQYHQPRQLDPGTYQCAISPGEVRLTSRCVLRSSRTNQDVECVIAKTITEAANPLANMPVFAGSDLQFAGYTLTVELKISPGASSKTARMATSVGLWQLLQLPHPGQMIIPTCVRSDARVFFGQVPENDLAVEDGKVAYQMRAQGQQKIGVLARACIGRVGYTRPGQGAWSLVVRDFHVDPSGAYVDAPFGDANDTGYAVQACNIHNEQLGSFSEMEHHAPAIGGSTGLTRCTDVSSVWAFRGSAEAIRAAADFLLTGKAVK